MFSNCFFTIGHSKTILCGERLNKIIYFSSYLHLSHYIYTHVYWDSRRALCLSLFKTDVNECLEENSCPINAECINTRGSFRCECTYGFTMVGSQCQGMK